MFYWVKLSFIELEAVSNSNYESRDGKLMEYRLTKIFRKEFSSRFSQKSQIKGSDQKIVYLCMIIFL